MQYSYQRSLMCSYYKVLLQALKNFMVPTLPCLNTGTAPFPLDLICHSWDFRPRGCVQVVSNEPVGRFTKYQESGGDDASTEDAEREDEILVVEHGGLSAAAAAVDGGLR